MRDGSRTPKPQDQWVVYGQARRHSTSSWVAVTRTFYTHEDGWQGIMNCRLDNAEVKVALVHTTHRMSKTGYWRPVNTVLLRLGEAKAWFE